MLARWWRRFDGFSEYLGGVFVAVLLLPIVPDVAVDWFGKVAPPWLLRVGSLLIVVAVMLVCFHVRERARARAGRIVIVTGLHEADTLALALSPERDRPTFTGKAVRKGHVSAAEVLIDNVKPRTVVAVLTPAFGEQELLRLKNNLADQHIDLVPVRVDDANDPTIVVPQIRQRLTATLTDQTSLYIDVTGGTKAVTLGMTSAAALLGAECVYVGSRFGDKGHRLETTQQPYTFDPRALLGPHP